MGLPCPGTEASAGSGVRWKAGSRLRIRIDAVAPKEAICCMKQRYGAAPISALSLVKPGTAL